MVTIRSVNAKLSVIKFAIMTNKNKYKELLCDYKLRQHGGELGWIIDGG